MEKDDGKGTNEDRPTTSRAPSACNRRFLKKDKIPVARSEAELSQDLSLSDDSSSTEELSIVAGQSKNNESTRTIPSLSKPLSLHFPAYLPFIGESQKRRQKNCRVCSNKGIRKQVVIHCPDCEEKPGLCLECFKKFHGRND